MLGSQHDRVLANGDWRPAAPRVVTLAVAQSQGEEQGFPIGSGILPGMGRVVVSWEQMHYAPYSQRVAHA